MLRGDIFWEDLGDPQGSEPVFRRPVLIVQSDMYNNSRLATTIALSLTSNIEFKETPGCVFLTAEETGLSKPLVANTSQIKTVSRQRLDEYVGQLDDAIMVIIDNTMRDTFGL